MRISAVSDVDKAQDKKVDQIEDSKKKLSGKLVEELMEHFKKHGINFKRRWSINQEGSDLAIRDIVSSENLSNSRYLLFEGKKVDV